MKISLLIAAGLVILATSLPSARRIPEGEAHAPSMPGKAAMRERVAPGPREADVSGGDPRREVEGLLAAAGDQAAGVDFEQAVASWAARDPRKVLDWLAATDRGDLASTRTTALAALAWEDPEDAARWLVSHPDHGGFDHWAAVLAPWSEIAPAAAHAWVRQHLEADMREALRPVMLATCREPGVIAALLDEGVADETLVNLARGLMSRDPGFARLLVERVEADELRETALNRLARHHGGTDLHGRVQHAGAEHQDE